jgi:hypothetical protein
MLRILLTLLILANVGFWIWNRPDVVAWHSPGPQAGREPRRLEAQIDAKAIRLLTPVETKALLAAERKAAAAASAAAMGASAVASAASSASAVADGGEAASPSDALVCLQSPALNDEEFGHLTQGLQQAGFSRTDWLDVRREFPGRWGIHMGKFEDTEQLERKAKALRQLKVEFEELKNLPDLSPGLMLGRFNSEAEARQHLAELGKRGVRTAKLVTLKPASVEHRLRIDALTSAQARKVRNASASLHWRSCPE